jgi:uncharacterized protein (DUF934 family)
MPTLETELYRGGRFVADDALYIADDAPLPVNAPANALVIVSKKRYLSARSTLDAWQGRLGLVLETADTLAELENTLDRFATVVLRFARYADGRPYSLAQRLRHRLGYRGELRAAGDVLQDQIVFMLRGGFDALEIAHAGTRAALRANRIIVVPTRGVAPAAQVLEAAE